MTSGRAVDATGGGGTEPDLPTRRVGARVPVYERRSRVSVPLERVWAFHVDPRGFERLTPDWVRLRVDRVESPREETDEIVEGTRVAASVRPLGVGPRRGGVTEFVARHRSERRAVLVDRAVDGPLPRWEHTHEFVALEDGGTELRDRVEYALPGGPIGRLLDPAAKAGLALAFRYRHRRTRELLADAVPS